MIIPINDKLRIRGTERCWELQRPRLRKGKKSWESFKWFISFGGAVESAIHREIRVHPARSLVEALQGVSEVIQRFESLIPSKYGLQSEDRQS